MAPDESVSLWVRRLQDGDPVAAQKLWERYFARLVALAGRKLHGLANRAADEEDVALSAFDSFCRRAKQGRFPLLTDRHNLWRLLVKITIRKARQLAQHERRQKRDVRRVDGRAALAGPHATGFNEAGLEDLLDQQPTPQFAAQVAEEYQRLLASLPKADLRAIAQWKMEGYTNQEIAAKLGCVLRTVERRLEVIRTLWDPEAGQ